MIVPPQPSDSVPQSLGDAHIVFGVHGAQCPVASHASPLTVHAAPNVQQSSVSPPHATHLPAVGASHT
jgi:hypothetical protein